MVVDQWDEVGKKMVMEKDRKIKESQEKRIMEIKEGRLKVIV